MAVTTAGHNGAPPTARAGRTEFVVGALRTARRWSAARGVDLATGLGSRERLLADLAGPYPSRRRLELVSLRSGDGLDALLATASGARPRGLLEVVTRAARAHRATAYHLGGMLYAFLGVADESGSPMATLRQSAGTFPEHVIADIVHGDVVLPDEAQSPARALALAIERLRARTRLQHRSAERQVRDVLLQAVAEGRAGVTGVGMPGVAAHAVAVGRRMGLDLAELDVVVRAAELQDVGKLAIPDSILNKQGPLTDVEWEIVRRHPIVGARIVGAAPALEPVARIVRSCSERFDGSGYPDGLRGDEIPLGSRIIAVCVAFDAMTSTRPYRPARPADQALAELGRCIGVQFDPAVVAAFCAAMGEQPRAEADPLRSAATLEHALAQAHEQAAHIEQLDPRGAGPLQQADRELAVALHERVALEQRRAGEVGVPDQSSGRGDSAGVVAGTRGGSQP
jgi:HD-GYP domain-containing protein (c-di-GMP phosphodiesterase class II)